MISKRFIFGSVLFSLLISIVGILTQNPKEFENSRFGIFIKILSSLAFILVAMGLILTAQAFEENQRLTLIDQTHKLIDRSLLDPIDKMSLFYSRCPNFIKSLWPQKGIFDNTQVSTVEEDPSCILDLSIVMIQAFEDHFTGSGFDSTDQIVWSGNFLQWASSDKFQEIFNLIYPNFSDTTIEYCKLLFEYANKNGKIKDAEDLMKRSEALTKDERLINIYKKFRHHGV